MEPSGVSNTEPCPTGSPNIDEPNALARTRAWVYSNILELPPPLSIETPSPEQVHAACPEVLLVDSPLEQPDKPDFEMLAQAFCSLESQVDRWSVSPVSTDNDQARCRTLANADLGLLRQLEQFTDRVPIDQKLHRTLGQAIESINSKNGGMFTTYAVSYVMLRARFCRQNFPNYSQDSTASAPTSQPNPPATPQSSGSMWMRAKNIGPPPQCGLPPLEGPPRTRR